MFARDVPDCTSTRSAVSPPPQADLPHRATPSHKLPSTSSEYATLTTPHHHTPHHHTPHHYIPHHHTPHHHRLPGSHNSNFNWSPDIVLLRQQGRRRDMQCNIITGAPLRSAGWRVSQGQRWRGDSEQEGEAERERRAPLLTLRDQGKPRRSERLRERSIAGTSSLNLQGFHLVGGQPPATSRSSATGSTTYSRHPHPLRASSPQSLSITVHGLSGTEHKTERWRQADS